ncbi:MAG: helix-turn-helix transcriptional regulator [Paludibacteraceae bacterium]|nr:helix-turn-helix transcriptional regulator [Paludibacteraceae bacterium]
MNERQRLIQLMESEGMNAKSFAQEVGISQGTLSNIMGGRNKPSLEVLQAVLNRFRTVQSDWLILGVGNMYRTNGEALPPQPQETKQESTSSEHQQTTISTEENNTNPSSARRVTKIMVFYDDGTFEER